MPASRWSRCLAQILEHEGGYADHPNDPGGATKYGITRKTLARWRDIDPWWDLPKSQVEALTRSQAASIYKALYWDRVQAVRLPPGVDLALFDFAVNSGPARAIKTLQGLVGVVQDGSVGPVTLAAVARRDARVLVEAICDQRMRFLERLAHWPSFGRGWTRRVAAIRAEALGDCALTPPFQQTKGVSQMSTLDGYKTYIVGAIMLAVGIAQALGIEVPPMGEYSGAQLVMEALAVIFLRRGLKSELSRG